MEYISKESTIDFESALKGECIDSFGAKSIKVKPIKFEIGKTYKHNDGKLMKIIGELHTTFYGDALIGENDDGTLIAVGKKEENAVNWHETKDLVEYLTTTD